MEDCQSLKKSNPHAKRGPAYCLVLKIQVGTDLSLIVCVVVMKTNKSSEMMRLGCQRRRGW